jgi:hypothetical protein
VAQGWKLKTMRPNPEGGADLQGLVAVHIADQLGAIVFAKSKIPDAIFEIDSEASPEFLDQYDVKPGQFLILIEGH